MPVAPPPSAREDSAPRWSGDAWLALRTGTGSLAEAGSPVPVYGGSQGGAVLRYSLAPDSRHRPAAYLRAVSALEAPESDLAAGLSARPFGAPLNVYVEARVTRRGDAVRLRPAAFLSAGVDALPLSAGFEARGYAQAGYVGGRDATAFADGSLVAERPALRWRDNSLAAGAGVWGGAQRGAARLDLGPSASLRFKLGEGSGRIAADYRLRVAGNANPAASAALTLSAGF